MSNYRLRKEFIQTSQGVMPVEEFTVYTEDIFRSLPVDKKLSIFYPQKQFTSEDKLKIYAAIERVNLPEEPEAKRKSDIFITLDEAITYLVEKSPGEKRQEIIKTYSKRQIFYWLKTAGNLHEKLAGKHEDEKNPGEFEDKMQATEKALQAVPDVSLEAKRQFFAKEWGKSLEAIIAEFSDEKINSAWRNYHMQKRKGVK